MWLNRDKIVPVKRNSIGYVPGPLWHRRNKFVLHAYWKRFRKVEDWFRGEKLFDYDFADPHDLLKFHSFLLISPLSDPWLSAPSQSVFRDRCIRAEHLAHDHFKLPHARGEAPKARMEDDEGESSSSDPNAGRRRRLRRGTHRTLSRSFARPVVPEDPFICGERQRPRRRARTPDALFQALWGLLRGSLLARAVLHLVFAGRKGLAVELGA